MKRVRLVKESSILKLYPTVIQKVWDFSPDAPRYQGGRDGAKHKGGLPPSTCITNSEHVFQTAKTFGQRSRDNVNVLSAPVKFKIR